MVRGQGAFENIFFSTIARDITGVNVTPGQVRRCSPFLKAPSRHSPAQPLDPVFVAAFQAVLSSKQEHRHDNVKLGGAHGLPCFVRMFPVVECGAVVCHFHNRDFPWYFCPPEDGLDAAPAPLPLPSALADAVAKIREYAPQGHSSFSREQGSASGPSTSFRLSDDFQLPFPLSARETGSGDWLPKSAIAAFAPLSFAMVQVSARGAEFWERPHHAQWALDGSCLGANAAACRLCQIGDLEFVRFKWDVFVHPNDLARFRDAATRFVANGAMGTEFKCNVQVILGDVATARWKHGTCACFV